MYQLTQALLALAIVQFIMWALMLRCIFRLTTILSETDELTAKMYRNLTKLMNHIDLKLDSIGEMIGANDFNNFDEEPPSSVNFRSRPTSLEEEYPPDEEDEDPTGQHGSSIAYFEPRPPIG